jgi:hypothetical protein
MKRFVFAIVPAILLTLFLALVPVSTARLVYRIRHGEWPISLHRAVETAKTEANDLFLEHSILPFALWPDARQRFMDTYVEINSSGFRYFLYTIQRDGSIPIFVPQSVGSSDRSKVGGENFKELTGGLQKLNRAYISQCHESGVKVVDLTAIRSRWGDEYFQDTLHFSDLGAQTLGQLLSDRLAEDADLRRIYAANLSPPREMPTEIR